MTESRRLPRLPIAPEEGWFSLALVAAMMLTLALAVDDAVWVGGSNKLTDFLTVAALLGVFAGFVASKVGWNRWLAHAIGAVFAALIVPILVGQVLAPHASIGYQYAATAKHLIRAWNDLVVIGLPQTRQIGHHLLVLGLLCWGTGQFAAAAVFRHHRPLSAVVVIGAILVGNMAATLHDQLGFLILFSLAALFLLTRLHALDEQATWARRRIGDPATVGSIYLRGGTVFIMIAIVGSLALTATARSAPLAGAWDDFKPWLLDVSASIQRYLPTLQDSRGIGGIVFGPSAPIRGQWTSSSGLALTIQRDPTDDTPYYWRAVAYDHFNYYGWDWSTSVRVPRPAETELLGDTFDSPSKPGTRDVSFTVTPQEMRGSYIVSPLAPLTLNVNADLLGLGKEGFFQAIDVGGHAPYAITARVPLVGDEEGGLTENLLRVAGTNYPPEIAARYLQLPTDGPEKAVGPYAQQILDDVLQRLKDTGRTDNPFDLSVGLVNELQSRMTYDPNVLDVDCGTMSAAECFAKSKRGYCEHYATLMTVLLRSHGYAARYVMGFLPGDLDPRTGTEQVKWSRAHAWVEVYFPGHGWYPFDPTGGGLSRIPPLPEGKVVASAPPSRFPSLAPFPLGEEGRSRSPGTPVAGAGGGVGGGVGPGGFILVTLILVATVAILAFAVWRRGPRGPLTPEGAWSGIGRLAARFGFGPRPTQTTYEYATALGDVLPGIRPELQTVATAKVEVAYGGRVLGEERIRAIRESYARLRVGLLRLLFRRRDRPKR
jgi:transglutaminase-like putative cysteine protease